MSARVFSVGPAGNVCFITSLKETGDGSLRMLHSDERPVRIASFCSVRGGCRCY